MNQKTRRIIGALAIPMLAAGMFTGTAIVAETTAGAAVPTYPASAGHSADPANTQLQTLATGVEPVTVDVQRAVAAGVYPTAA
ncbi:hypothetical protein [Mycolicibacterium palauense]|uniref:hypothetical protein n=1 Tax=Mycolicibacterium palauense TaxID=2034511 RepID=UPI000BFED580|nr:hypothetical protein [Mycolicibacterium palauense]